jgi:hypothetical protein
MRIFHAPVRPMAIIHNLLVVANSIIIVGGAMLAGRTQQQFEANLPTARDMRVTGQSIFLAINTYLLYCILSTIREFKSDHPERSVHPTLYLLLAAWPLLFVRGLYGILSSVVPQFNYFSFSNYGPNGLTDAFVVSEYVLSTTMEWTSCALLMSTYITSLHDPKKGNAKAWDDIGKQEGLQP